MLITLENVRFGYDDKIILENINFTILENINFTVSEGERIGLIGANGEGKTTLIRLMTGALLPDEGRVLKKSGLKLGILEQNGGLESDRTVYDEMRSVFRPVLRAMDEQREIEGRMAHAEYGGEEYRQLSSRSPATNSSPAPSTRRTGTTSTCASKRC